MKTKTLDEKMDHIIEKLAKMEASFLFVAEANEKEFEEIKKYQKEVIAENQCTIIENQKKLKSNQQIIVDNQIRIAGQ